MLQHNVYFYLKEDLSEEEIKKFETGLKSLMEIKNMVSGFVGKPAETADRPVVDKKYSFALSTTFHNVQQHDAYQDHPTHHKFINTCKEFWKEVKVFDVEY